jgi:hypothetical protein
LHHLSGILEIRAACMPAKPYSKAKIGVKDKGPIEYSDSYNLRYFE